MRNMNLRAGPGTVYPIVGELEEGKEAVVVGRYGEWYLLAAGEWVYGGEGFTEANEAAVAVPSVPEAEIPPTPTPTPTFTPTPTPTPAGPKVYRGDGWEIIDKSDRYDFVFHRPEALDYVLHEFFGDRLFKVHPHGIRYTVFDDTIPSDGCWPNVRAPRAPIPLSNLGYEEDRNCLAYAYGGARDELIFLGCVWDGGMDESQRAARGGIYHDPEECFIAMPIKESDVTHKFISALIVSFNLYARYERECPGAMYGVCHEWPDFFAPVFAPLGTVHRDGDKWRWENPFLEVVKVGE